MKLRFFSVVMVMLVFNMPFLFTGQSAYTNEIDGPLPDLSLPKLPKSEFKPKFKVKVTVSTEDGPDLINDLVKGYVLAALRKIPDITIVGRNEDYYIALVPLRTNAGFAVAYRVLRQLHFDYIKDDVHFNSREKVKDYLSIAYVPHDFGIFTASRNILEQQCRGVVVQFDAGTLQPIRELYE